MRKITVVGLGPGDFSLLTLGAWEAIKQAENLILRTKIHPTVSEIVTRGVKFETYDSYYERAASFEELYEAIAEDLLSKAQNSPLTYAVPGSPMVAERTVTLLRQKADTFGVHLNILPGMSFLEILYTRLALDPIEGLMILDAEEPNFDGFTNLPIIFTQVWNREIASDLKLKLMDFLPEETNIVYVRHLSLPDESISALPLYELDRQKDVDHLTSVFLPNEALDI